MAVVVATSRTDSEIAALAPVQTVAGRTGGITLSPSDISGLGTLATQNANAVSLSGGTANGLTITGLANPSGSSDAANKSYVDAATTGFGSYQSDIDCSGNPNYPAAQKGWQYYVNVAGRIGGASGPEVEVGDALYAKAANAGGTHAAVGSSWMIQQTNIVGALRAANNLGDVSSASTARSNLGLVIGTNVLAPDGNGSSLTGLTSTQVGLGSVTNDAQTKAAIVPNTVPSAGQLLVGNAGGTAFGIVSASGDATISSAGVITLANSSGTRSNLGLGSMATQSSSSVLISGGSIGGITDLAVADGGTGASDGATACANLGAQSASGNLTATITTSTPSTVTAGVLLSTGSAVASSSPTNNRVLAWSNAGGYQWVQVNSSILAAGAVSNTNVATSAAIDALKLGTGVVDNTEFNRLNGCTEDIQPRLDSLKVETTTVEITTPTVSVIRLYAKAQYAFTINGVYGIRTTSGTATAKVTINGTSVTGLSSISVTSTTQDVAASGANTVAVGDIVALEFTAVSSPSEFRMDLKVTRT